MSGPIVTALVVASIAAGDFSLELRFVEGLRERGMWRLAELHSGQLLQQGQLEPSQRLPLVVELAKCYTAHALHARRDDREALWAKAREAVASQLRADPDHPRAVVLQLQDALTVLARGELARQEVEVAADREASLGEARDQLRAALRLLEAVDETLTDQQRRPARAREQARNATAGLLTPDQLRSLRYHVAHQLARAFYNQALCYPPGSADRINSLTQALQQLGPLARMSATDDGNDAFIWESRVDEIACQRLLGDAAAALAKLAQLDQLHPPAGITARARAEHVRLLLDQGKPDEAHQLLSGVIAQAGAASPELDLAAVETHVALCQAAAEAREAQRAAGWQDEALKMAAAIERRHGTYWSHRAALCLARIATLGTDEGHVKLLERTAESYLRRDLPDDAAQAFTRAALKAEESGDEERAFQFRYKAGLIEHQRDRHRAAIDRLRDVALRYPTHSQAPESHLLAAYNCSSLIRLHGQAAGGQETIDEYLSLLEEHLQHWPSGVTADKARWWLGRFHEQGRRWLKALEAYLAISPQYPGQSDLLRHTAFCYDGHLATLERDALADRLGSVRRFFDDRARMLRDSSGASSDDARQAARLAARFWLIYPPADYAGAERLLVGARTTDEESGPQDAGRALLVAALAGGGEYGEAMEHARRLSASKPAELVELLRGLRMIHDSIGAPNDQLAQLQLNVADLLQGHMPGMNRADLRELQSARADAYVATARRDEATEIYRQLAAEHPEDARVQHRYAELLLDADTAASPAAALEQWRLVLRKTPARTDEWFQAKYGVALAHYKLGQRAQARQIILVTQSLHPDLGGTAMKQQFLQLMELCEQ